MLRPRFAFLLGAVAVVGLAATGCAEQSAAIRVGDDTVSEKDMLDELDAWAGNETLVPEGQVTGELGEDSYIQPFVSSVVQQRVVFTLYEQIFDDEGLELTPADRTSGREMLDQEFGAGGTDEFPADYAEDLTETAAKFVKLQQALGPEELQSTLIEAADKADIEVSSRFGSWDNDAFIAGFQAQSQDVPPALLPPPAPRSAGGDEGGEVQGGADPGSPAG